MKGQSCREDVKFPCFSCVSIIIACLLLTTYSAWLFNMKDGNSTKSSFVFCTKAEDGIQPEKTSVDAQDIVHIKKKKKKEKRKQGKKNLKHLDGQFSSVFWEYKMKSLCF